MSEGKIAGVSQTIHYRNYRRARDRAMTRLVNAYPDQYKEFLQEERAADESNDKKWVSSGATVRVRVGSQSLESGNQSGTHTSDEGENTSNDGGEA